MLASLDRVDADTRADLYRALVAKRCPEAADAFFAGLREDTQDVAHAIYYRLYVQKHLAPRVLDELVRALPGRPRTDHYVGRLLSAIREWPDFPIPDGLEPRVRELLPGATPKPKQTRADVLEETLAGLENGRIVAARRARRTCTNAEPAQREKLHLRFSDRLRAVAGGAGSSLVRGLALDYLRLLGAPLASLAELTHGLPRVTGIRELEGPPIDAPIVRTRPWMPSPPHAGR